MKKLAIMLTVLMLMFGYYYTLGLGGKIFSKSYAGEVKFNTENNLTDVQKAEISVIAELVKSLRDMYPGETTVINQDTFEKTADSIQYLIEKAGYTEDEYSMISWTTDISAHYNIYLKMKTFPGSTFITEATFQFVFINKNNAV